MDTTPTDKQRVDFADCYAEFDGESLTVGNERIERRWHVINGLLHAASLVDRAAQVEWLAVESHRPAPCPPTAVPEEPRRMSFRAAGGRHGPVQRPSLQAELTAEGPTLALVYRIQVFPGVGGISLTLESRPAAPSADERGAAEAVKGPATPTGNEEADLSVKAEPLPTADGIEQLALLPAHLRLVQVSFRDQTDVHNELVFENEWLLHPNEALLGLAGNLFILENPLTGDGLILLKHAPLPGGRPIRTEHDLRLYGRGAACPWSVKADEMRPGHPSWPMAYRCGLYGHGIEPAGGEGYPHAVLTYSGGSVGRTEALHAWQRCLRPYQSGRDGLLLTNTWGDRSKTRRIRADFIDAEIDAAARLGADVVQIDDGWEQGVTAKVVRMDGQWAYWDTGGEFWQADPERFPHGLEPLIAKARAKGLRFGLWFAPNAGGDYAAWEADAQTLLRLHRTYGVDFFKIDGVMTRSRAAERNLRRLFERVLSETDGKVTFDFDVTAGFRPGYFGLIEVGPIFVENRYTDWHGWWPHQTLRTLWKLARYIDPLRLRMEMLNYARNAALYADDPLAPAAYSPAYIFATVLAASPLGWFEVSNLPESYFEQIAPLAAVWKEHRAAFHGGRIFPIGSAPDGVSWTGFASASADGTCGYALVFRELTDRPEWSTALPMFAAEKMTCTLLAGEGAAQFADGRLTVRLPAPREFLLVRLSAE